MEQNVLTIQYSNEEFEKNFFLRGFDGSSLITSSGLQQTNVKEARNKTRFLTTLKT